MQDLATIEKESEKELDAAVDMAVFEYRLRRTAEELKIECRENTPHSRGRLFRYVLPTKRDQRHAHSVMIHIPPGDTHCQFIYTGELAAEQALDMLRRLAAA